MSLPSAATLLIGNCLVNCPNTIQNVVKPASLPTLSEGDQKQLFWVKYTFPQQFFMRSFMLTNEGDKFSRV